MSKFGAKTYSRRQELKSNVQFDQLFSDTKNKPSTAKVSAGVQRWGVATFTSLRKSQLNGQKEHEQGASKRVKMDSPVAKSRTSNNTVLSDDPFLFELDKDASPVKKVRTTVKQTPMLPGANKKSKPTYSKPNKFFKSSARNMAAQNNPPFNPTVVLEKTFCYDVAKSPELKIVVPSDVLTTEPTVVKLLSPTKLTTEEKHDAEKPSAFDLLLSKDSSATAAENETKRLLPCRTDDWFSVFDTCDDVELSVVKWRSRSSSPEVQLISEHKGSDSLSVREKASLLDSQCRDSLPATSGRTYTRDRSQVQESCDQRDTCKSLGQGDRESSFQQHDAFRLLSPSKTMDFQDQEIKQDGVKYGDDIFSSDSATPCSSQEVSSPRKQDCDSKKKERSRTSIFKSRSVLNKKKAVYKHRPWQDDDKEEMALTQESLKKNLVEEFEDEIEKPDITLMKRISQKVSYSSRETITSWKCDKKAKELYTVVHNVKQAYQCHESGETQEFNDEVEYLLEGIQPKSSLGTRCLSTVGWATKCMLPAFRIHLRAHGTIPRVFSALMDAPKDLSLSLCTATLMFVLSQDRLTMDLEASTLSLMLQLLEAGPSDGIDATSCQSSIGDGLETISFQQASKMKEKVRQLCEEMQQKGYAKQLNLENITTGNLAMETLLSLTSRKAGEWFKEGIRNLGGLDYIVDTVNTCSEKFCPRNRTCIQLSDIDLSELKKIDRCLRVLENVTYMNPDNQSYLLQYKNAVVVSCCFSMLQACQQSIAHNPIPHDDSEKASSSKSLGNLPGYVLLNCILSLLKVLLNLTHESEKGCSMVGSLDGLLQCILLCILRVPQFIPPEERFDLLVLALGLLINMMERCEENRNRIAFVHVFGSFDSPNCNEELSALEALVEVFLSRVEAARQSEEQADALLDAKEIKPNDPSKLKDSGDKSTPSSSQQSQAEELEETLMKALQKAGKNMEHSIIAAYIALLLGCIIQNKDYADLVRDHMPNGNFNSMVEMLRKFLNFVSLTGVVGTTGLKSIQRVLKVLESS